MCSSTSRLPIPPSSTSLQGRTVYSLAIPIAAVSDLLVHPKQRLSLPSTQVAKTYHFKVLRKSHMDDDEKKMLFNEINNLKEPDLELPITQISDTGALKTLEVPKNAAKKVAKFAHDDHLGYITSCPTHKIEDNN